MLGMTQVMKKEEEEAKSMGIMNMAQYHEVQRKMQARAAIAEVRTYYYSH